VSRHGGQRGFTYLGLLLAVALLGAGLAATGSLWSVHAQREREAELLFAGDQIRAAIRRYYEDVPLGQQHRFPQRLDDLLLDRRWPTVRRHLRRIYLDPVTGGDWVLVPAPSGGILGVHSRSAAVPLKRQGFGRLDTAFEDAVTLSDWRFVYRVAEEEGAEATQPAAPGGLPTVPLSALPQFSPASPSSAR
jgi:type II secretory pathway pseudopilin PulG